MNQEFNNLISQLEIAHQNLNQSLERLTEAIRERKQGSFAQGGIVPNGSYLVGSHRCTFAEDMYKFSATDDKTLADCQTAKDIVFRHKWRMDNGQ